MPFFRLSSHFSRAFAPAGGSHSDSEPRSPGKKSKSLYISAKFSQSLSLAARMATDEAVKDSMAHRPLGAPDNEHARQTPASRRGNSDARWQSALRSAGGWSCRANKRYRIP